MNKSNYDDKAIYGYLEKIFSVKYDRPVIFDVYGHTCDIGTYQENLSLSKKRANTIASMIKKYIRDNHLNGIVREVDGEAWTIMDLFYKLTLNNHPERRLYSRNANVTAYLPISCDSIQLKTKGE